MASQPAARLEAELLLAFCLRSSRAHLYAHPGRELTQEQFAEYLGLLGRRRAGEPIAYLTGTREFWSLPLRVTPDVLIPRPETELLVELALQLIPVAAALRIADLGTGSGAIALAIASERPRCEVWGVDISAAAVAVARENAARLSIDNVEFHRGHWCEPLTGRFDLIASNPPYVALNDPHLERGDCRFEPRQALTPGTDALTAIREIAGRALTCLKPGGWLLLEHGPGHGGGVRAIMKEHGFREISTLRDVPGHERVTVGKAPG